ncbi:MAG: restriction endonuclease subunit S, partial [Hyphomicrobiaceae bacterium]
MKSAWQSKQLGSVCSFLNRGVSPKYVESGGIAVLNQRCVRGHRVSFDAVRRHDTFAKKVANEKIVRVGDVLVNSTGTGTLGRVAQLRDEPPEPTTVDSHITIVRPEPGLFFQDFFGYMMRDIEDAIKESGEGASGQTELSRTTLAEKFVVRYPESKEEQRRIVGILDESFEGVATAKVNAETNLKNARALFESELGRIFAAGRQGWTYGTVGDLIDDGTLEPPLDGNHGEIHPKKADFVDIGIPFIMASDLKDGTVDQEGCSFITRKQAELLRKGFARDGDVLLSHKGTIGRVAMLYTEHDFVMLTPQVTYFRISAPEKLLNRFLYYALQGPGFAGPMGRIAGAGSTRAYIGITKQRELPIGYPCFEEQVRIADRLDALSEAARQLENIH